MVANKFGKGDRDRIGKEKTDKPLKGPGSEPRVSALIGGVGNLNSPSATKSGAKRGGGGFPFSKKKAR